MIIMNRLKSYEKILSEKGLSDYPYIRKFILDNESFDKPFVLGAGTSSGKTFMSIIWLELFYLNSKNKGLKTLVFPSSTVVLRDNFGDSLREFNPTFTYCVCEDGNDIKSAIKSNCDVIVVLPQTAIRNINLLKSFNNFILDEAHQWYFDNTVNQIIKKIKPKNQILLTGSPAKFVAKKENYHFQFVPVLELFDLGKVSNVKIEVVSTSYNFKISDYNYDNNLRKGFDLHTNAENQLVEVCKEMIKKLKNPIKGYQSFNNITKNTIGSLFNFLEKTIIFCQSKKQADEFYKILSNMKDLENKVLISHSESDKESLEFRNFKEQSKYQILIAVDRGKLGFNIPDLFNVIDFTFTQNLSMLLQMYGRLLRLSKSDKPKIFYKVAPKNMAPYFVDIVTALCSLLDYEWYSKFNGKNMDEIVIRKVSISKKRSNIPSNNNQKKSTNKLYSIEQLGIPLDLNLLKTNIKHSYDGKFVTVAETTLGELRKKFFEIKNYIKLEDVLPFEEAKILVKKFNIKNAKEYGNFISNNLNIKLPKWPQITYKDSWNGYGDYLGTGTIASNELKNYRLSYNEARNLVIKNKITTRNEYKKFRSKSEENILILPANPEQIYKNEWNGYGEFFGTGNVANQNKQFLSLQEAKEFLKGKNLDIHKWRSWIKSSDFPSFLPKDIYCVYSKDKNWKGLRDLFSTQNEWNGPYKLKK
jgi:superfamily II DNA or RNA helicase